MKHLIHLTAIMLVIFPNNLMAKDNSKLKISKIEAMSINKGNEYFNCLNTAFGEFSKFYLNDKDYFPIFRIKDEDVYKIVKSACAEKRRSILQDANDKGVTARRIDEIEKDSELALLSLTKSVRVRLESLVQEIRVPGPRKAVNIRKQIIHGSDYPQGALRAGDSAFVTATFTIGIDGKVTQCSSTGVSELLNSHTCTLITQRSSYAPALDSNQRAVEQTDVQKIRWSNPE